MKALLFLLVMLSSGYMTNAIAENLVTPGVWFKTSVRPKAVILIAHGLNLKPEKMDILAGIFATQGADVLRLTLSGHEGDMSAFKNVTAQIWDGDFRVSYTEAIKRSQELNVPLYFVGFSLGGLVGVRSMGQENSKIKFDRMALLAPALSLKIAARLVSLLKIFGRGFCVPSANLPEYRVHSCTPMAAYSALLDSIRDIQGHRGSQINIPTLVMMDSRDEMVSPDGMKKFIAEKKLTNWNFIKFTSSETFLPKKYHHLVIDEASAGLTEWKVIVNNLLRQFSL